MSDRAVFRLRTMRLIHFALCMGMITFAAIAVYTIRTTPPAAPEFPLVSYVLLAAAIPPVLTSFVLPGVLEGGWRAAFNDAMPPGGAWDRPRDEALDFWWEKAQARLIIRSALLEAPAFMNLVAYLVEGQPVSLVAAAVCLGLLLVLHPTRPGVDAWVAGQIDRARQRAR